MPDIKIEIKNLKAIKAAFSASPSLMTRQLNLAIRRSIIGIQGKATENAPIRDGGLRASIVRGASFSNLKGTLWPNIEYAYYVHEGTGIYVGHKPYLANIPDVGYRWMKGMKPRPFLRKAVETEDAQVQRNFVNAVQNTLDEIGKKT